MKNTSYPHLKKYLKKVLTFQKSYDIINISNETSKLNLKKEVYFMEKKMTRVEMFNAIKAIPAVAENEDMVEFLDHQIELASKKSVRKADKEKLAENEVIKTELLSVLTENGDTVTNIMKKSDVFMGMPTLTSQRITSLLSALVAEEKAINYKEKGKSYYKLA